MLEADDDVVAVDRAAAEDDVVGGIAGNFQDIVGGGPPGLTGRVVENRILAVARREPVGVIAGAADQPVVALAARDNIVTVAAVIE